jgi:hypothetical protein
MLPTGWASDAFWMLCGANIFFSYPEWKHDSSLLTIPTELFLHVVVRKHELEGTSERAQNKVYRNLVRLLVARFETHSVGVKDSGLLVC